MNDRSTFKHCIKRGPNGSCVEVWSDRPLPYPGGTQNPLWDAEIEFKTKLQAAIKARARP